MRGELLVLAPERRRQRPDVGVGPVGVVAEGEVFALGEQRPTSLLGQGEGIGDKGEDGASRAKRATAEGWTLVKSGIGKAIFMTFSLGSAFDSLDGTTDNDT